MFDKRKTFEEALTKHPVVDVLVQPEISGVDLPRYLQRKGAVRLQFGLNLPKPIKFDRLDEWGVACVLSFGGAPWPIAIPWNAVIAIEVPDSWAVAWSVPAATAPAPPAEKQRAGGPRTPRQGGHLRLLPPPDSSGPDAAS